MADALFKRLESVEQKLVDTIGSLQRFLGHHVDPSLNVPPPLPGGEVSSTTERMDRIDAKFQMVADLLTRLHNEI